MCVAMKFLVIAFLHWVENNERWENISVYLNVFKALIFTYFWNYIMILHFYPPLICIMFSQAKIGVFQK